MKTLLTAAAFIFSLYCFAQEPKLVLPDGHADYPDKIIYDKGLNVFVSFGGFRDQSIKGWDRKTGLLLYTVDKGNSPVYHLSTQRIATVLSDKVAVLYDLTSGKEVHRFLEDAATFYSFNFTPDGKALLAFSYMSDSTFLHLYDCSSGKLIYKLFCGNGSAAPWAYPQLLITPNGKEVVTSTGKDPRVKLWDLKTGKLLHVFSGNSTEILTFSMSPDGTKVFSYSWRDSTGFIWDIKTRKEISRLKVATNLFTAFAGIFSSNNRYLITQNKIMPEEIAVWQVSTGKKLYELGKGDDYDRKQYPAIAVFSKAGNSILCNNRGWVTQLMNLKTGRTQLTISDSSKIAFRDSVQTNPSAVTDFSFSPNGEYIITRNIDEVVKVWNTKTGQMLYSFGAGDAVLPFQFSVGGEYLLVRSKMKINVWDLASGKLIQTFSVKGHTTKITSSSISADNLLFANAGSDYHIRLWNLQTAQLMKVLNGHTTKIRAMSFNPDKTMLVTGVEGKAACIWDIERGWVVKKFEHGHEVTDVSFSADGKIVLTASADGFVRTWNSETGKLLNKMQHNEAVLSAKFSPDGKYIISGSFDKTAKGWDAVSGKELFRLNHIGGVDAAAYYPDGQSILTHDITGKYFVWDSDFSKDKMELMEEHGGTGLSFSWQFTPDGKYDVAWFRDTVWKWNRSTGKLQKNYFPDGRYKMNFSNDGKWLYVNAGSEQKFYSTDDYSFLYRIVAIDSTDYFTQIPSGYYQCTPAAAKQLHYVTKDQKIITFDQLDVKYNRPDKVLEAIGNTDTAFINSFKRAYIKRIKKLGIDTAQFREGYSVPEADIVSREQITYQQRKEVLTIKIHAADSMYMLDRFNIWINEVPLFGLKGISINHRRSKLYDTTIAVHLSQGDNRIETSVTNVNGTESYHMPLFVNYSAPKPVAETVYFMGIGINEFADSTHNLRWCVKDIRNLAQKLKEKYPGIVIDTLFNNNVTISNVRKLKQRLLKTTINDKVIIAYSGHGMLSKQYDYYLSSFDVNFSKPEENGIAYEEIENLLDGIPARKKLLLLDACHSGELDKDELLAIQDNQQKTGNRGLLVNRGSNEEEINQRRTVGLQNSFELMQSLFVNVGKGTGAVVIAAAGGVQFAQERGDLQNGVFSFALLEAMEQYKTMTVSQLKAYVEKRVEDITKGHQRPTTRKELKETDWTVW